MRSRRTLLAHWTAVALQLSGSLLIFLEARRLDAGLHSIDASYDSRLSPRGYDHWYYLAGSWGFGLLTIGIVLAGVALALEHRSSPSHVEALLINPDIATTNFVFSKEKQLVAVVFAVSAGNLSAAVDSFASWILGGFAAGLALLLSNLDKIQTYIGVGVVRRASLVFLIAASLGIVEKFFALIITTAGRGFTAGGEIGRQIGGPINVELYFEEAKKGFYQPARWLMGRIIRTIERGDIPALTRRLLRMAQLQVVIAFIEAALIVRAVYIIVRAL